jgi:hypothetical protein
MQRINKIKSWFLEKHKEYEKLLVNMTIMRREKTQVIKSETKSGS